jgi:hypothetical protein
MQVLLEHRMDQDTLDLKNDALIVAAENGHYQVLKLLILAGANVDFRNNNRDPVLLRATRSGHVGVVRVLLENGADVDIKGPEKQTALEIEVRKITPAKGKQVAPNRDMKSMKKWSNYTLNMMRRSVGLTKLHRKPGVTRVSDSYTMQRKANVESNGGLVLYHIHCILLRSLPYHISESVIILFYLIRSSQQWPTRDFRTLDNAPETSSTSQRSHPPFLQWRYTHRS